MSTHCISPSILFLALILCLAACSSGPDAQTLSPITTSSTSELATFFVALPEAQARGSPEEIAEKMFALWLDHFKYLSVDESVRLDDYLITEVVFPPEFQLCAQDLGIEYIARVLFSVRTIRYPAPDWVAGNGTIGDDHWINDKTVNIAVFKTGDAFSFRILGAPACAGIAIDGTRVP